LTKDYAIYEHGNFLIAAKFLEIGLRFNKEDFLRVRTIS